MNFISMSTKHFMVGRADSGHFICVEMRLPKAVSWDQNYVL